MMKKWVLVLIVAVALCLPGAVFGKMIKAQGTIQGLMSTCEGQVCTPGEEMLMAAMEEIFILLTDSGESYLLPNVKSAVLSRYLNKMVRVEGEARFDGKAIMVSTAEAFEKGKWRVFYSPELVKQYQSDRRQPMP
jgi:hypothetical protein